VTDAFHTALAGLIMALAMGECERAAGDGSFLTCASDRSFCASSVLEVTPQDFITALGSGEVIARPPSSEAATNALGNIKHAMQEDE
jgi:hypothetical protein